MFLTSWVAGTFRHYPEIAIFLTLALGYYFGKLTFKGIGLGRHRLPIEQRRVVMRHSSAADNLF